MSPTVYSVQSVQTVMQETFGKFLRRHRRALDLTQNQLADLWGKSQTAISDYENERRTIEPEDAQPLADALRLTAGVVLEAAGFRADHIVSGKSMHRFIIGEFKGKPVEVVLRDTPSEE